MTAPAKPDVITFDRTEVEQMVTALTCAGATLLPITLAARAGGLDAIADAMAHAGRHITETAIALDVSADLAAITEA